MIGTNFVPKTATVAPVKRIPYAEASRALLRDSVLDAMRDLLLTRDWSAITLSDVARAAGISRQTIYNEFGSRQGRLRATRCAWPTGWSTPSGRRWTPTSATSTSRSCRVFGPSSPSRPPTRWCSRCCPGWPSPTCCSLITTDSAPIINRASARLATAFTQTWLATSDDDANVLSRAIVRLCLSYVPMPPESDHDVAADLARLMAPFAERHGVVNVP